MAAPSPLFLLLAALVCSIVGRAYLFRAALSISKQWGIAVIFVPFAPLVFRMKFKELAHEGKSWQTWAMICGLMFFAVTGSTGSFNDLWTMVPDQFRPASMRSDAEFLEHDDATNPVATAASATALAATPVPLSYAERLAANQLEFARLGEVYETLKREKGYLRKHDDEGIRAYNASAAKYQAELAKARTEQTELNKLVLANK